MTGEMSQADVTQEDFPLHFALAAAFAGAMVRAFDQYQGPYVYIPSHGRFWLCSDDGYFAYWYSEKYDKKSDLFILSGRTFKPYVFDGFRAFSHRIANQTQSRASV